MGEASDAFNVELRSGISRCRNSLGLQHSVPLQNGDASLALLYLTVLVIPVSSLL
jgi:hypothetical protein